jgi:hypothetical protein
MILTLEALPPLFLGEGGGEGSCMMPPFLPHSNPLPEGEGTKNLSEREGWVERTLE